MCAAFLVGRGEAAPLCRSSVRGRLRGRRPGGDRGFFWPSCRTNTRLFWLPLFGAVPDLVVRSAKEYIRSLALAEQRADAGAPPVTDGSGAAMDCFAALEDEIAAAEARLVQNATSFRELHVLSRIVRNFEKTGHALARSTALVARHLRGEGGES